MLNQRVVTEYQIYQVLFNKYIMWIKHRNEEGGHLFIQILYITSASLQQLGPYITRAQYVSQEEGLA